MPRIAEHGDQRTAELREKPTADPGLNPPASPLSWRTRGVRTLVLVLLVAFTGGCLAGYFWAPLDRLSLFLSRETGIALRTIATVTPPLVSPPTTTPRAAAGAVRAPLPHGVSRTTTSISDTASVAPTPSTTHEVAVQVADYHVQVGAFNVLEYARELVGQLRSHDYAAVMVDVPTGPPHRVWVAGTFDRVSAERLINRLRQDGFDAILIR